ncbi:ATP-dependent DNA helicase srs2 [Elasticomyces elasticus]|nr:ATP-dependent DNA helicase srs2 [Elasticomyces elasticus]KAK4927201.1 ATP-dependent DNA helicase srs2 [Elasticomyces elasticus]
MARGSISPPARKPMNDVTGVRGNDKLDRVVGASVRKSRPDPKPMRQMQNSARDEFLRKQASEARNATKAIAQAKLLADKAGLGEAADDESAPTTPTAVSPPEAAAAPPSLGNTGKPTNNKRKSRPSDEQDEEVAPKKLKSGVATNGGKSRTPTRDRVVAKARDTRARASRASGAVEKSKAVKNESKAAKARAPKKRKAVELLEEHYSNTILDAPAKRIKRTTLSGLKNETKLACFSNSVIQVLDGILEGKDLDQVFGPVQNVNFPGITQGDLNLIASAGSRPTRSVKVKKAMLLQSIREAGVDANTNVKNQLRKVLEELRYGASSQPVAAFLMRMVMAFEPASENETEESVAARESMSGETQQDCFEYYQALLDKLCDGANANTGNSLADLVEISNTNKDICSNGCDLDQSPDVAKTNSHILRIEPMEKKEKLGTATAPEGEKQKQPFSLQARIDSSMKSISDQICTKCGTGQIEKEIVVTATPESLIIKVDRVGYNKKTKQPIKHMGPVELPEDGKVTFADREYQLSAVVFHNGETPHEGHYRVCRKYGKYWQRISVGEVTAVKPGFMTNTANTAAPPRPQATSPTRSLTYATKTSNEEQQHAYITSSAPPRAHLSCATTPMPKLKPTYPATLITRIGRHSYNTQHHKASAPPPNSRAKPSQQSEN